MSITENSDNRALQQTLQQARAKLTRQTDTVKATIALIKLLEQAIRDSEKLTPAKA